MNGWTAFRTGLSRAARHWRLLAILFAVNLASGLLLAALPALGLADWLGRRPAIREAADGMDAWLVIETLMAPLNETALGGEGASRVQQAFVVGLLTVIALPLLAWLPSTFLSGGVLLIAAESPEPFRFRRFLWGCWHWFGPFLLLGVAQGIVSLLWIAPIVMAVAAIAAAGWLAWVALPLLALAAGFWLALWESTRTAAVVGEIRNIPRAFGRAARFVWRAKPALAVLYGLALLLLGLLHALTRGVVDPHLVLVGWPLALAVRQAFILARLWARLVRLAGNVALYKSTLDFEGQP